MDKLKYIRLQQGDDQYYGDIPIGVDAENVDLKNGNNLQEIIGDYDYQKQGSIKEKFDDLLEYTSKTISTKVVSETAKQVAQMQVKEGQTVIDATLTVAGAAAEAKETGKDITELKNETSVVNEEIFDTTALTVNTTINGWRLNNNGLCFSANDYKLVKYAVTEGSYLKIVSSDRFQFQTIAAVPSTGSSNRVGITYSAGIYYIEVPSKAKFLVFSAEVDNGVANAFSTNSNMDVLKTDINTLNSCVRLHLLTPDRTVNNYRLYASGTAQNNQNYKIDEYKVTPGDMIYINSAKPYNSGFASYIFQSNQSFSEFHHDYLIGEPVLTATHEEVTVPEGASWILFSSLKTEIDVGIYDAERIINVEKVVGECKDTTDKLENVVFNNLEPDAISNGYSLKGDGLCQGSGARQLNKYVVYAGSKMFLDLSKDGDGVYQWQSSAYVPVSETNDNLIGTPVNDAFNGFVTVPEGATYLIVSQLRTNTTNVVKAVDWRRFLTSKDVLTRTFNSSYHLGAINFDVKCKEFSSLMYGDAVTGVQAPTECEAFLFFTDPHLLQSSGWEDKCYEFMAQIQKYYNSTPTTFCLCGGDWLGNSDLPDVACYKLGYIDGFMQAMFDNYYMLVGNHDTNYQGKLTEESERFTTRLSNQSIVNLWYRKNKKAYYKFDGANTKFYCFDTGIERQALTLFNNYGWEQAEWFANSLLTDNSPHIAICGHILYDILPTDSDLCPIAAEVFDIAGAYNSRTTIEVNGTSYDFTGATGKIEFSVFGHAHADYNGIINGIPYFLTLNAGKLTDTASFDMVFVDYDNNKINLVRVGSGNDRVISMATGDLITQ